MTKYEKTLRTIPIVSFGLLIFLFGMFIIRSYKDVNRTIEINVEARSLPVKTYQRVELDVNSFVTSREGTLYWKPDSFKEAFVLRHIADTKLSFNLIDILYLLVINCILFWMFMSNSVDFKMETQRRKAGDAWSKLQLKCRDSMWKIISSRKISSKRTF